MPIIEKIIRKKPLLFLLVTLVYLFTIMILKWGIHVTADTGLFLVGGFVGLYFLDAAEEFFRLSPSPFRTIIFVALFAIVSFFVVTSSASYLAGGLVLSIYLTIILWQIGEWLLFKHLNSWYRMWADPVVPKNQLWMLIGSIVLFIVESALFVRSY